MERLINLFGKNNSSYLAYSIIQEYYSKAILEDNKKYLNDASEFINRQLSRNNADVRLVLYSAFIDIEMGNSARAEKNIHLMYKYTKYFKINDEVVYCAILFLNIIFDIKYKKGKKADKLISILDGEVQKKNLWVRELFMAYIYMEKGESDELTARRISNSFIYGAKSRFYYILLYKYYNEKGERLYKESKMLVGFLKWGLCHNAMLEGILDRCNTKIPFVFFMNSFTGARLYNKYPNKWILEQLCKILMCNLDHSVYAFDVYNSAVRQQIEVVGLIDFLIKSGYENDIDDIGIYPIKRFLEQGNVDFEMKVYIYYIILGNKKFSELRDEYEKDIIDVGIKGIKKNKDERYFYEIYKFLLDKTNKYEIDAQTEQTAEDILYKHLFEYEVKTEKKVSYIWIREKEKNKLEFFEVNDGKAYITASGNEFDKYFFDDEKKTLIESNAVIRRCIKNADMRLYVRYYLKGKRDNNILINLAKYYMNIENANEKNIFILKEALEEKNISRNFRMRLRAAIGNIYFGNGEYKEAAEYYKYIDINMISEKSVENMTRTFLEADEKKKLTEMIVKREHCLEDKTLYLGIKKIYDENEYAKSISASSYRLLMQGYTDRLLINLVIKNYKGSIGEWKSLRKTMKNYNMEEKEIDEKILESCIMMHIVDADSEDIFCSIYNNDKENRLIGEYVQLLCYKIIAEKKSIENMTLKTLERIYKEKGEDIVAVAIGEIYLRKRYEGEKDDFIIGRFYDIIEKNKILFPEFKDKDTKNPYIEKNMPFIYRTAPNKKVYLHYRRLDENMYSVKEMNYFRYGFYMSRLSVFYGEKIEYFFSEKLERGSIESKKYITENKEKRICEVKNDDFFKINNALIYAEMFQYDKVEDMIEKDINNKKFIKGRLL